ncbi:MAG: hypothetical protein GEV13_26280 [Rhodospirillales bacterium]|nr:hypothetical protein [Rhodospirillales bacterium]
MADLHLYDSEFDAGQEKIIAKGMFGIAEKPVPIDDWKDLAAAIQKHTKIGHLACSFHSFGGGMIVGSEGRELGEESVAKLFTKPLQVDKISFFGCNVGNRPVQMAAFGKIFGAKSVAGFTWWMIKTPINVKLPKGVSEKKIKEALDPFAPYSVELIPAANVLVKTHTSRKDHEINLVAVYGSPDGSTASTLPIPLGEQKNRKPWKEAVKKTIKLADAAATEKAYDASPIVAFELLTVTLK